MERACSTSDDKRIDTQIQTETMKEGGHLGHANRQEDVIEMDLKEMRTCGQR